MKVQNKGMQGEKHAEESAQIRRLQSALRRAVKTDVAPEALRARIRRMIREA